MDEIIPNDDIDSVKEIICDFNFEGNKYNYLYSAYINKRHDVFKYLVKEKDVSLFGENDFNTNLAYQIIDDDCIELFEYILLNSKEIIVKITT